MDGQYIRPGIRERRNVFVGIGDHQMNIQRKLCCILYRSNNRRTEGDVRDEMTIHHIHMNQMCTRLFDLSNVFTERSKIGRQDGRRDANAHWLTSRRMTSDGLSRYPA